uniref:uncharacterized protein LOC114676860 n=1 Tax=Macaca mulatta TaxID=9544 RepID=UPI0010A22888|nr:uncharacterized protein LOC114676860 [Macaca mulatta]
MALPRKPRSDERAPVLVVGPVLPLPSSSLGSGVPGARHAFPGRKTLLPCSIALLEPTRVSRICRLSPGLMPPPVCGWRGCLSAEPPLVCGWSGCFSAQPPLSADGGLWTEGPFLCRAAPNLQMEVCGWSGCLSGEPPPICGWRSVDGVVVSLQSRPPSAYGGLWMEGPFLCRAVPRLYGGLWMEGLSLWRAVPRLRMEVCGRRGRFSAEPPLVCGWRSVDGGAVSLQSRPPTVDGGLWMEVCGWRSVDAGAVSLQSRPPTVDGGLWMEVCECRGRFSAEPPPVCGWSGCASGERLQVCGASAVKPGHPVW